MALADKSSDKEEIWRLLQVRSSDLEIQNLKALVCEYGHKALQHVCLELSLSIWRKRSGKQLEIS